MKELSQEEKAAAYDWIKANAHLETRDGGYTSSWHLPRLPGHDETPYSVSRRKGYEFRRDFDGAVKASMKGLCA